MAVTATTHHYRSLHSLEIAGTDEPSRMEHEIKDITIIGGGPTGLFALFYAGMRGATAQIVDALPELGGQLTALYPEKYIFDVAGYPKVLAKDLVKALRDQAAQFNQPTHLGQRVTGLHEQDGHFVLETDTGPLPDARDRHRGGHRRVLTATSAAGQRRALVRPRHLRRRDRPAGLSRTSAS